MYGTCECEAPARQGKLKRIPYIRLGTALEAMTGVGFIRSGRASFRAHELLIKGVIGPSDIGTHVSF